MRKSLLSLLFLLLIVWSTALEAHQSALSYLEVKEHSDLTLDVTLKRPLQDIEGSELHLRFPRRCQDILPSSTNQDERYLILNRTLWCSDQGIEGSSIWVDDLLESDKGVVFRFQHRGGSTIDTLITAARPQVPLQIDEKSTATFAYFWLGVEHILLGIDHLLFVLALLLLVSDTMRLIGTITAFTLAHSITLGLAVLGVVTFSVPYIEAMIALSIMFLARELLLVDERTSLTSAYPWIVSFLFGLLHGLGFASALSDAGLPDDGLPMALLLFNLGVEAGQLLFIFSVLLLMRLFAHAVQAHHRLIRLSIVYGIGITATYWFIERSLLLV